jgi:hypothetical protein
VVTNKNDESSFSRTETSGHLIIWEGECDAVKIKVVRSAPGTRWELRLDKSNGTRLFQQELESREFDEAKREAFVAARTHLREMLTGLNKLEASSEEHDGSIEHEQGGYQPTIPSETVGGQGGSDD